MGNNEKAATQMRSDVKASTQLGKKEDAELFSWVTIRRQNLGNLGNSDAGGGYDGKCPTMVT